MPGPLFARLGVLQDLRIEIAVAVHRLLEDLDRPRQRADLVGAVGVGNLDVFVALGDALDGGGDRRKRPRDRAGDDHDAEADHDQRQAAETGQQKRHVAVGLGLPRDLLGALGVDLGERLEILVQRGTHRAIGVVVAPFAAGGGIDLDAAANQFLAEVDELLDAFLERGELLGVIGLDDRFPVLDHAQDLVVELEKPVAELLHGGGFAGHVDAAGFHHDRVDQRIDALDIEGGAVGGLDRFRQLRVAAGCCSRTARRWPRSEARSGRRSSTAWPRAKAATRKRSWKTGWQISTFQTLHGLSSRGRSAPPAAQKPCKSFMYKSLSFTPLHSVPRNLYDGTAACEGKRVSGACEK